jgi:outer membrane receptor protein involved in Fe transport
MSLKKHHSMFVASVGFAVSCVMLFTMTKRGDANPTPTTAPSQDSGIGAQNGVTPAAAVGSHAPTSKSAAADDLTNLSLEDLMNLPVTSTISRVGERADLAPGNVYVYDRKNIQNHGYRSLGELLQVVPGFNVGLRDLDFVVGVRGLLGNDNDKVSLLVNGQNLNGPHEQDFLNGPINLDNVDRVEVVVGPSSLFQNGNTLAATINVITKTTEGVELVSGIGNDLRYSETLMAGHEFDLNRSIDFSFTTLGKKGFNGFPPALGLTQTNRHELGAVDWPSYFSILSGKYGELSGQFVAYRDEFPETHIDGGSPLNDGEEKESKYSLYLKAEHPFTPTLTAFGWAEATQKSQTRLNQGGPPVNAVQESVNQWDFSGELGLRYTGIAHHLIQTGIQAEYDYNYDTWFSFLAPGQAGVIPPTTMLDKNDYNLGFYIDDEYQMTDHWKLVAGARVDHSDKIPGDQYFPGARAAIIDEVSKSWTTKLVYNRAVRMPSALEALNDQWGTEHIGSPTDPSFAQLSPVVNQPEILSTFEWDNQFFIQPAQFGFNVYHQELQNFIGWFQPHSNGGNLNGNGVELTAKAPLGNNLTFWANAAWNDSKLDLFNKGLFGTNPTIGGPEGFHAYTNSQGRIIGSPEYTANVGLDYAITQNLHFAPTLRYFTNQAAAQGLTHDVTIRNRYYLDATLTWAHLFGKDMDAHLSVYNILDNRQPVAIVFAGDTYRPAGTTFVLSLDYRF